MTRKSKNKNNKRKHFNNQNNGIILTKSFGGIVNTLVNNYKGPIPSIFQKESDDIVEKRKFKGGNPINIEKRKLKLISTIPYDLEQISILSHPKRPVWNSSLDKTLLQTPCLSTLPAKVPETKSPLNS